MVERLTGGARPYLLLSLLALLLYLPGLVSLPPMDRDESRFVQATRQMLETGDYIRIQFQKEMRAKKPVGAYWLQAASVHLLSEPESNAVWPYRLPSALAAWAAVLMTFAFGQYFFGRQVALLGGALLACSLILVSEAHQAKTDAIMLACAVAAQGALARVYLGSKGHAAQPGPLVVLTFWVATGLAILVKGPVIPAISLLTILALGIADRQWAWLVGLRPFTGVIVAAAIAAPWFVAISKATGGAFVGEAVKSDLLPKLLGSQESHGGPPGTYLALAAVTLWPGSLLLWPSLAAAWKVRVRPEIRFCLAWLVPAWVMFEIVPTKLPHYVMPTFPAIALLMAVAVVGRAPQLTRRWAKAWYGLWCVVGLALAAAVVLAPQRFAPQIPVLSVPYAVLIAGTSLVAGWLAMRERLRPAILVALLAGVTAFQVVFAGILPRLDTLFVSREAAQLAAAHPHDGAVVVAGYSEPSLVFLLGTDTEFAGGDGAAQNLAGHPTALSLVSDREESAFQAAASRLGVKPQAVGVVKGFNYSRGKPVVLTAYMREEKAP